MVVIFIFRRGQKQLGINECNRCLIQIVAKCGCMNQMSLSLNERINTTWSESVWYNMGPLKDSRDPELGNKRELNEWMKERLNEWMIITIMSLCSLWGTVTLWLFFSLLSYHLFSFGSVSRGQNPQISFCWNLTDMDTECTRIITIQKSRHKVTYDEILHSAILVR